MSRLDEAVRDVLATMPAAPDPGVMRSRLRRRRRVRRGVLITLVAVLAVGVVAVARSATNSNADRKIQVEQKPTGIQPAPTPTPTTEVTFAASPPKPVDPTAPEPTQFFAAIGGGGERIALVDVATGRHGAFLTPPSQALVRFSSDLATIYEKTGDAGCGYTWTAVDVATGATRPAYQNLGTPIDVVESPDGNKVAYVRPLGKPFVPGCKSEELVVREKPTGRERHWIAPLGADRDTITQLEWSPDSAHVSYLFNASPTSSAWILDINHGTTLTDGVQLRSPHPDCRIDVPRFRPGTSRIIAAENCQGRSAQLLDYNASTGAVTKTTPIATGPVFGIIDLAVDASGTHVLYILSPLSSQPAEVYTLRNGTPVPLLSDAYEVAW